MLAAASGTSRLASLKYLTSRNSRTRDGSKLTESKLVFGSRTWDNGCAFELWACAFELWACTFWLFIFVHVSVWYVRLLHTHTPTHIQWCDFWACSGTWSAHPVRAIECARAQTPPAFPWCLWRSWPPPCLRLRPGCLKIQGMRTVKWVICWAIDFVLYANQVGSQSKRKKE